MSRAPEVDEVAGALLLGIRLLVRRLRQTQADDDLPLPQMSALARLERDGPSTANALAKLEQVSPQSVGATLGALEARGLVERRPDPADGRQAFISATEAGRRTVGGRRRARTDRLTHALADDFTAGELEQLMVAAPLIERLAQRI